MSTLVSDYDKSNGLISFACAGLALLIGAWGIAYAPTFSDLLETWASASAAYGHAYLIVLISVLLVIRSLPALADEVGEPNWALAGLVVVFSLLWLVAREATVASVESLLLPAILLIAVFASLGSSIGNRLAFPILYLYFAAPAWYLLQFVFQAITVFVVDAFIQITDLPVLVAGDNVILPNGMFEIADGCGGLNYLLAALALGVLYAHLYGGTPRRSMIVVGVSALAAMLGNWVRVFALVVIGYESEMRSSLVHDHLSFGWVIFVALMLPLIYWARTTEHQEPASDRNTKTIGYLEGRTRLTSAAALFVVIGAMLVGPSWAFAVTRIAERNPVVISELPRLSENWIGPESEISEWQPNFVGADKEQSGSYRYGDDTIFLYRNVYRTQERGREIITFNNSVGGTWHLMEASAIGEGGDRRFMESIYATAYGRWVVRHRYHIGDHLEVEDTMAKVKQPIANLTGTPAGVVALATRCRTSCAESSELLDKFSRIASTALASPWTEVEKR